MIKKAWDYIGWIVGAYTVYSHLKTLDKIKDEVYSSLSSEQQKRFDTLVGNVKSSVTPNYFNQPLVQPDTGTQIEKVLAGV